MVPPKDMNTMYISWQIMGVMAGLISLVLTVIGRVLQLSITNAIAAMAVSLEQKIEAKFSSKESVEGQLKLMNLRMEHMESQLQELKAQRS